MVTGTGRHGGTHAHTHTHNLSLACAGVLGQITTYLGTQNVNIEQQINTSRGDIAYTVLDFGKVEDPAGLQVRARAPNPQRVSLASHGLD